MELRNPQWFQHRFLQLYFVKCLQPSNLKKKLFKNQYVLYFSQIFGFTNFKKSSLFFFCAKTKNSLYGKQLLAQLQNKNCDLFFAMHSPTPGKNEINVCLSSERFQNIKHVMSIFSPKNFQKSNVVLTFTQYQIEIDRKQINDLTVSCLIYTVIHFNQGLFKKKEM